MTRRWRSVIWLGVGSAAFAVAAGLAQQQYHHHLSHFFYWKMCTLIQVQAAVDQCIAGDSSVFATAQHWHTAARLAAALALALATVATVLIISDLS